MPLDKRPLVVHLMYRFDTGGLENGVVNLVNHMPAQVYRHAIVALSEITDFRNRIERSLNRRSQEIGCSGSCSDEL